MHRLVAGAKQRELIGMTAEAKVDMSFLSSYGVAGATYQRCECR